MTCIAGIVSDNKVFLAGERGASDDNYIVKIDKPKIWKSNGYIFGYAGTFEGQHLQNNFIPPTPEGNLDKFMHGKFLKSLKAFYEEWGIPSDKDTSLSLLIGIRGKLYEHESEGLTLISYERDYVAIGSGSPYAMGSLYSTQTHKDPKRRLMLALNCATDFSPSCIGPIDILSI